MKNVVTARPLSEWHEDMGDVLWWTFPITEPPYVGSPLDLGQPVEVDIEVRGFRGEPTTAVVRKSVGGWPGYHTHWTPIPMPSLPDVMSKNPKAAP